VQVDERSKALALERIGQIEAVPADQEHDNLDEEPQRSQSVLLSPTALTQVAAFKMLAEITTGS
jgi:hypothetical protein